MRSLIIKINLVSFRTFRHPLLPSFLVGSSLQQDSSRKNYYFQKSGGLGLNGTLKAQMNMVTVWEGGLRAPETMSPLGVIKPKRMKTDKGRKGGGGIKLEKMGRRRLWIAPKGFF